MSIKGSAYGRFKRALATGNLNLIRAAAAELPAVRLDDALEVCVLLRDREPDRYDRATVRWIARFCVERPDTTLADVQAVAGAFALMPRDPAGALALLQRLCA